MLSLEKYVFALLEVEVVVLQLVIVYKLKWLRHFMHFKNIRLDLIVKWKYDRK